MLGTALGAACWITVVMSLSTSPATSLAPLSSTTTTPSKKSQVPSTRAIIHAEEGSLSVKSSGFTVRRMLRYPPCDRLCNSLDLP